MKNSSHCDRVKKKKGEEGVCKTMLKVQKGRKKNFVVVKYEEAHRGGNSPEPRLLFMFVAYFVKEGTVKACEICPYLNIMEMTLAELVSSL